MGGECKPSGPKVFVLEFWIKVYRIKKDVKTVWWKEEDLEKIVIEDWFLNIKAVSEKEIQFD